MPGTFQMNTFGGYGGPRPTQGFQQQAPMMGQPGQQTNMFTGMNMTINVNQYGQVPQQ